MSRPATDVGGASETGARAPAGSTATPARRDAEVAGPGERAALEAQRDFLLRSLQDLEMQRDAGELTTEQFDHLTGAYTARAAAVLRVLDRRGALAGRQASTGMAGRTRKRRLAVASALALVVVAAVALVNATADRGSGQTITGNAQSAGEPTQDDALARAVQQDPDDLQARLTYARFLLGSGDVVAALEQFDAAVRLDPANPEGLAYSGWILALAGMSEPRVATTDTGLERIDRAIAADPGYPDAHAFRGLVLLDNGDAAGAVTELQRYLELAPDSPLRSQVEAALAQARQAARSAPQP